MSLNSQQLSTGITLIKRLQQHPGTPGALAACILCRSAGHEGASRGHGARSGSMNTRTYAQLDGGLESETDTTGN